MAGVLTDEVAKDFMTTDVITTTAGTPIEGASKIMFRNYLKRIPIVGKAKRDTAAHSEVEELEGIVTSNDILRFLGDNELFSKMGSTSGSEILNRKVSEIMEEDIITVEPLTRLGELCEILREKDIGGAPVVKNGELVGIITENDILRAIHQ